MKTIIPSSKLKSLINTLFFILFSIVSGAQTGHPITLTGYNQDVIADSGLNQNISTLVTSSIDLPTDAGYTFYAQGYSNNGTAFTGGLPDNGIIISNAGHNFQLAPFNDSNDLRLLAGDSGTLFFNLSDRTRYDSLFVLDNGGSGGQYLNYRIFFSDGSDTTGTFVNYDWGCNFCPTDTAVANLGRASISDGSQDVANGNAFAIWENMIFLGEDSTKAIDSIRFSLDSTQTGAANIYAITGFENLTALPVTLVSFWLTPENGRTLLQWKTSQGTNNVEYIIQRATQNNEASFIQIGNVNSISAPNGSTYSFLDNPGASGTYYYRLLQEDIDGNTKILGIRSITLNSNNKWVVLDQGSQWELICAQPFIYRLLDLQGRVIKEDTGSGNAIISKPEASGVYQLQVSVDGVFSTQKLIK